jgi:hypothetical protein
MMAEFASKSCRICGGYITTDAEICPLCCSRQHPEKNFFSTGLIIPLAGLGFFGVMLLGIMSAHAIQHLIHYRTSTCNAAALKNVKAAKGAVDHYIAHNARNPETLEQLNFKPDDGVTVSLTKNSDSSYTLVSFHKQGDEEFLAVSGTNRYFCKKRNQSLFYIYPKS